MDCRGEGAFSCRSGERAFREEGFRRSRLWEEEVRRRSGGRRSPSGSQSRIEGGRSQSFQGLQPSGKLSRSPAVSVLPSWRGGTWVVVFFLSWLIGSPCIWYPALPKSGRGGPEKVTICYQCLSYRFFPLPSSPGRGKKAGPSGNFPAVSTKTAPRAGFSVPYGGWKLVTEP